jgi:O-antigen/teichoic acid export membrane protein
MKRFEGWKRDLLIAVGFLLLPLLLYAPVTLGSQTMIPADNLFQWQPWASAAAQFGIETPQNGLLTDLVIENYAWKRFFVGSIKAGEIPLWQPYLFGGSPFLATGQHSMLYPFSWLFLLLPITKAYGWYTVSQLWLAGLLMYVYGRTLSMRRSSAIIAGLIYQGSGFILASAAVFPMVTGAAAWLPLLLACIEKIINDSRLMMDDSTGNRQSSIINHQSSTLLWVVLGAIALGSQILAGHIEITYYTLLLMGLYALWRMASYVTRDASSASSYNASRVTHDVSRFTFHVSRLWKPAFWLLAMVLLGLLLGSVQLVPFVEVGQANFRQGSASFAEVQDYAFKPRRILTLVLPNFFGNPAHHEYVDVFSGETLPFQTAYDGSTKTNSEWGLKNYVEGGIYLGILPLFLTLLGMAGIKRTTHYALRTTHTLFFTFLSLLSLAFIFGTPLYALIYYGLPFANQLHTPFRWVFPLSLCVAVLAGFGMDYLARTRKRPAAAQPVNAWASDRNTPVWLRPFILWGSPSRITAGAGLAFWSGVGLLVGLFLSRGVYGRIAPIVERLFLGLAGATSAFPDARAFYSYEFRQLFILGLMLVGTGTVLRVSRCPIFIKRTPIYLFMAAVILTLDLFLANVGFNAAVDPALLDYKPELVQWLEQQPGYWRVTSFTPHGDKPFHANSGWLFDIQDVRGYDSIIPKQYTDYMAAIEPQNELQFNRVQPIANWESLNSPLLDVLGVKYIITAETIDLPKLKLAWEGEGLRVYENLAVAPRAYILPLTSTAVTDNPLAAMTEYDPRQFVVVETGDWRPETNLQSPVSNLHSPASIDAYTNIQVTVSAEVAEPSWLILNDSYFPGWKAWIRPFGGAESDEQQVDVIRVNGNFRGVLLEPGHWTVRFRYSPVSFQLGALASAMGGIILLFALGLWGWRRVVKADTELTTTRSLAKNSAAPMVLNLFNKGIDFVFAMFYLRVMGPADAGSFQTAIALAGIFEILSNFGLDILVVRDVSKERAQAGSYLLNTTILRLGTAVVASLPMIAIVAGTNLLSNPFSRPEILAIGFIMLGMVLSGMSKGAAMLFYVYEKAEVPAAMTTATTILKVGLGVVALLLGYSFVGLAAVSIITNVITLTLLALLAVRSFDLGGPRRIDWRLQRRMIRLGFPLMLIHLLQTVFISVDVYLLRTMLDNGEEVVGWYGTTYKWFNALQIVPSFFTLALFPIISREIERSLDAARRMYRLSLKLMLLLALPIAVVFTFWAYPLVQLLAGDEFLPHGAIALQIVIWSIPFGWLNSVTNYVLIALGLERMQPRAFAVAVAFNIITNLIFIPRFSYVAASITTILSELVLMALFAYFLRRKMPGMNWGELLIRPLLVTAIMVIVTILGNQIHIVVGLVLGLAVYPTGLWLLHVFGEEERHILRSILPKSVTSRLGFLD